MKAKWFALGIIFSIFLLAGSAVSLFYGDRIFGSVPAETITMVSSFAFALSIVLLMYFRKREKGVTDKKIREAYESIGRGAIPVAAILLGAVSSFILIAGEKIGLAMIIGSVEALIVTMLAKKGGMLIAVFAILANLVFFGPNISPHFLPLTSFEAFMVPTVINLVFIGAGYALGRTKSKLKLGAGKGVFGATNAIFSGLGLLFMVAMIGIPVILLLSYSPDISATGETILKVSNPILTSFLDETGTAVQGSFSLLVEAAKLIAPEQAGKITINLNPLGGFPLFLWSVVLRFPLTDTAGAFVPLGTILVVEGSLLLVLLVGLPMVNYFKGKKFYEILERDKIASKILSLSKDFRDYKQNLELSIASTWHKWIKYLQDFSSKSGDVTNLLNKSAQGLDKDEQGQLREGLWERRVDILHLKENMLDSYRRMPLVVATDYKVSAPIMCVMLLFMCAIFSVFGLLNVDIPFFNIFKASPVSPGLAVGLMIISIWLWRDITLIARRLYSMTITVFPGTLQTIYNLIFVPEEASLTGLGVMLISIFSLTTLAAGVLLGLTITQLLIILGVIVGVTALFMTKLFKDIFGYLGSALTFLFLTRIISTSLESSMLGVNLFGLSLGEGLVVLTLLAVFTIWFDFLVHLFLGMSFWITAPLFNKLFSRLSLPAPDALSDEATELIRGQEVGDAKKAIRKFVDKVSGKVLDQRDYERMGKGISQIISEKNKSGKDVPVVAIASNATQHLKEGTYAVQARTRHWGRIRNNIRAISTNQLSVGIDEQGQEYTTQGGIFGKTGAFIAKNFPGIKPKGFRAAYLGMTGPGQNKIKFDNNISIKKYTTNNQTFFTDGKKFLKLDNANKLKDINKWKFNREVKNLNPVIMDESKINTAGGKEKTAIRRLGIRFFDKWTAGPGGKAGAVVYTDGETFVTKEGRRISDTDAKLMLGKFTRTELDPTGTSLNETDKDAIKTIMLEEKQYGQGKLSAQFEYNPDEREIIFRGTRAPAGGAPAQNFANALTPAPSPAATQRILHPPPGQRVQPGIVQQMRNQIIQNRMNQVNVPAPSPAGLLGGQVIPSPPGLNPPSPSPVRPPLPPGIKLQQLPQQRLDPFENLKRAPPGAVPPGPLKGAKINWRIPLNAPQTPAGQTPQPPATTPAQPQVNLPMMVQNIPPWKNPPRMNQSPQTPAGQTPIDLKMLHPPPRSPAGLPNLIPPLPTTTPKNMGPTPISPPLPTPTPSPSTARTTPKLPAGSVPPFVSPYTTGKVITPPAPSRAATTPASPFPVPAGTPASSALAGGPVTGMLPRRPVSPEPESAPEESEEGGIPVGLGWAEQIKQEKMKKLENLESQLAKEEVEEQYEETWKRMQAEREAKERQAKKQPLRNFFRKKSTQQSSSQVQPQSGQTTRTRVPTPPPEKEIMLQELSDLPEPPTELPETIETAQKHPKEKLLEGGENETGGQNINFDPNRPRTPGGRPQPPRGFAPPGEKPPETQEQKKGRLKLLEEELEQRFPEEKSTPTTPEKISSSQEPPFPPPKVFPKDGEVGPRTEIQPPAPSEEQSPEQKNAEPVPSRALTPTERNALTNLVSNKLKENPEILKKAIKDFQNIHNSEEQKEFSRNILGKLGFADTEHPDYQWGLYKVLQQFKNPIIQKFVSEDDMPMQQMRERIEESGIVPSETEEMKKRIESEIVPEKPMQQMKERIESERRTQAGLKIWSLFKQKNIEEGPKPVVPLLPPHEEAPEREKVLTGEKTIGGNPEDIKEIRINNPVYPEPTGIIRTGPGLLSEEEKNRVIRQSFESSKGTRGTLDDALTRPDSEERQNRIIKAMSGDLGTLERDLLNHQTDERRKLFDKNNPEEMEKFENAKKAFLEKIRDAKTKQ